MNDAKLYELIRAPRVSEKTARLQVVKVDAERGLIAIRGAVPGAPGGDVIVRPSSKI